MGRAQEAGGEGWEKEKMVSFWEVSIPWGKCGCLGLPVQSDKGGKSSPHKEFKKDSSLRKKA